MPVRQRTDRGGVLILTLLLTTILALVVIALAQYASTGLKTSDVASLRTETNFDAASAASWAIEELAKKQLDPDADCAPAPSTSVVPVPAGLVPNGYTVSLTCAQTTPIAGEPVVHLISTVTDGAGVRRFVETTVEVPRYTHGARIADWRVDIPIDVPNYVTTTIGGTTTTLAPGNSPPVAGDVGLTLEIGAPFVLTLPASDPDAPPLPAYLSHTPPAAGLNVTPPVPPSLDMTLDAPTGVDGQIFTFTYTVEDAQGATDTGTINVTLSSAGPSGTTTTTTLAPNPQCSFEIKSVSNGGNKGYGTLALSNPGGGAFTGWHVTVSRSNGLTGPWSFSWSGPNITVAAPNDVSSTNAVSANMGTTGVATAEVTSGPPSAKLSVGNTFNCTVVSP